MLPVAYLEDKKYLKFPLDFFKNSGIIMVHQPCPDSPVRYTYRYKDTLMDRFSEMGKRYATSSVSLMGYGDMIPVAKLYATYSVKPRVFTQLKYPNKISLYFSDVDIYPYMETKSCCKCKLIKPIGCFCFDKQDNRYQSCCKDCQNQRTKLWIKKLKESKNPSDVLKLTIQEVYTSMYSRSKQKNTPRSITPSILMDLYKKQEGKCYYTGTAMLLKTNGHRLRDPLTISCDRIDPSLGYIEGNVVLCCWGINALKGIHTKDVLLNTLKTFYTNAVLTNKI